MPRVLTMVGSNLKFSCGGGRCDVADGEGWMLDIGILGMNGLMEF